MSTKDKKDGTRTVRTSKRFADLLSKLVPFLEEDGIRNGIDYIEKKLLPILEAEWEKVEDQIAEDRNKRKRQSSKS